MNDEKWTVTIRCDGQLVLKGDIKQLHDMECGMVRCWQFDCADLVQVELTREKTSEVKPA